MIKDDRVFLAHMLEKACQAHDYVEAKGREHFDSDAVVREGLTRLVQTVGEAARRISDEFQAAHSEIPWAKIIGMRHKVVHDYMSVEEEAVWQTIVDDLPILIGQLELLLWNSPIRPPSN